MQFSVLIRPGAKKDLVEKIDENNFKVWVKESAKEGRANASVIKLLADYFKVAKSDIQIIHGLKSKRKLIEIS